MRIVGSCSAYAHKDIFEAFVPKLLYGLFCTEVELDSIVFDELYIFLYSLKWNPELRNNVGDYSSSILLLLK